MDKISHKSFVEQNVTCINNLMTKVVLSYCMSSEMYPYFNLKQIHIFVVKTVTIYLVSIPFCNLYTSILVC